MFIIVWALSPGPVAVLTLHESRKQGLMSGIAVSAGAAVTSALMVIMGLIVYTAGITSILDSDGMIIVEQVGALGIILMGVYAGYKSLWTTGNKIANPDMAIDNKRGFVQGMLVMATYIPQALVFYNMIIPKTVEPQSIITTIIFIGVLKVAMIFGWHSGIAVVATRTQNWTSNNVFGKALEVATACLIMVLGVSILV